MALRHSHWDEHGRVLVDDENPSVRVWQGAIGASNVLVGGQWVPSAWDGSELTIHGIRIRPNREELQVFEQGGGRLATVSLSLLVDGEAEKLEDWSAGYDDGGLGELLVVLAFPSGTVEHRVRNTGNGRVAASYRLTAAVGAPTLRITHESRRLGWLVQWMEHEEVERAISFVEKQGSAGVRVARMVSQATGQLPETQTAPSSLVVDIAADMLLREGGVSPDTFGPTYVSDGCNSGPTNYYENGYGATLYLDENDEGYHMVSWRWNAPNLTDAQTVSSATLVSIRPNDHSGSNGTMRFRCEDSNTPAAWSAGSIPYNRTYRTAYSEAVIPADGTDLNVDVTTAIKDLIENSGYTYNGTAGQAIALSAANVATGWGNSGLVDYRALSYDSTAQLTIVYSTEDPGSAGSAAGTSTVSGVGASTVAAIGTAAGTSTASGVSVTDGSSSGTAAGTSTVAGVGASLAAAVGTAAGTSTASGASQSETYFPGKRVYLDTVRDERIGTWPNGEPLVVKDNQTGELLYFGMLSGVVELFKSSDQLDTISTVTRGGAFSLADANARILTCAQDASGALHVVYRSYTYIRYFRATLTRSGGAVTGWEFTAACEINLPGTYNTTADMRSTIRVGRNLAGAERLLVLVCDDTNPGFRAQMMQALVTASSASDFVRLTDPATSGTDVLYSGVGDGAESCHNYGALFAQSGAANIWATMGPVDDEFGGGPGGTMPVRSVVITPTAASTWSIASPTVLVSASATMRPWLFGMDEDEVTRRAWAMCLTPTAGVQFYYLDTDGSISSNVIASPNTGSDKNGSGVFSVHGGKVWTYYIILTTNVPDGVFSGYYDGSTWDVVEDPIAPFESWVTTWWGFVGSTGLNNGLAALMSYETEGDVFHVIPASVTVYAGEAAGTSTAAGVGLAAVGVSGSAAGTSAAEGVGAALVVSAGSSSGTATVTGASAAQATAVGTSAGTSAAAGVAAAQAASSGASAGFGAATGAGAALAAAVGTATGSGTATGVSATPSEAAGTAAGSSSAQGVGATQATSVGAAAGSSAGQGTGAALAAAVGSSAGTATVTGTGAATARATGTAAGTSAATGSAQAAVSAVGTAEGTSSATGASQANVEAAGTASGAATVVGYSPGEVSIEAVGHAAGTSTGAGASAALATTIGTATGQASASGIGASQAAAWATAEGSSTADATSEAHVLAVAQASGSATVIGVGDSVSIGEATGTAAGTSEVSGVATWISESAGSAAGAASVSGVSGATASAIGTAAGTSTVAGIGRSQIPFDDPVHSWRTARAVVVAPRVSHTSVPLRRVQVVA